MIIDGGSLIVLNITDIENANKICGGNMAHIKGNTTFA